MTSPPLIVDRDCQTPFPEAENGKQGAARVAAAPGHVRGIVVPGVDRVLDEADRAVAEDDVHPAGMQALGRDGLVARAALGMPVAPVGILPGGRTGGVSRQGGDVRRVKGRDGGVAVLTVAPPALALEFAGDVVELALAPFGPHDRVAGAVGDRGDRARGRSCRNHRPSWEGRYRS